MLQSIASRMSTWSRAHRAIAAGPRGGCDVQIDRVLSQVSLRAFQYEAGLQVLLITLHQESKHLACIA